MSQITIFHGSEYIIRKPDMKMGKIHNDYGQGFYCTEDFELAKEWACKNETDGFVNRYTLDLSELKVLNLNSEGYTVLNWIAILLKNRVFYLDNDISRMAREYIVRNFALPVDQYDVIIGYRADDSYFSFAESFVSNTLPLHGLNKALRLGKLGEQVALVSAKAFEKIQFVEAVPVEANIYYPKFQSRDYDARKKYRDEVMKPEGLLDDIFVLDIIREEMKNDDPRIQRNILK